MKKYLCYNVGEKNKKSEEKIINALRPQLCEGYIKISGRKRTQMLAVIISSWQNYGQFLFFYSLFSKCPILNIYYN